MTTLREHLENGTLEGEILEFYKRNVGQVPLCCFECKKIQGKWMISCSWLKQYYSLDEFTEKCLECQEEMKKKMKEGKE